MVLSGLSCLLLLGLVGLGTARHVLEHSFTGGTFSKAGIIDGDVLSQDAGLVLTRSALETGHHAQLKQAVEQDGFYSVRIKGKQGKHVIASVRAACLAADVSLRKEEVQLQVDEDGDVVGMAYSLISPTCNSSPSPPAKAQFPTSSPVVVHVPQTAPAVVVAATPGQAPQPVPGFQTPGGARVRSSGGPGGDVPPAGSEDGGPPPPVVDDRTWLQKNWMFCLAGCMMVFNIVSKLGTAQPGGTAEGAPAAAGGAPRTVPAPVAVRR